MSATTSVGRSRPSVVTATATGSVLALLLLAACGTRVASRADGDLPLLRIGAPSAVTSAADASGTHGAGPGTGLSLSGTLPAGPDRAAVQRFGTDRTAEDRVRTLAASLGLRGDPVRRAHGWEVNGSVGSTDALLRVRDADGEWSFSRTGLSCPAYLVDVDSGSSAGSASCAVADSAEPTPTPAVPVPDDAAALATAEPVLAATRATGEPRVLAYERGLRRTVVLDPVVSGLPTSGVRTVLDLDRLGVTGGYGRLGVTTEGPTYPLVTARVAYDRLAAQPRPMPELACLQAKDAPTVCPVPKPLVVTGATLGLELADDAGDPVLVPAWLFSVRGSAEPVVAIAVQPRHLADPDPVDPGPGSALPGSSGGAEPGTAVSPPSAGSGSPGAAVTAATVSADGRTLTLVGVGGACATYLGLAEEDARAVRGALVGTSTVAPDEGCVALAQEIEVRVALDAPLGSRAVTDTTTGESVHVTR